MRRSGLFLAVLLTACGGSSTLPDGGTSSHPDGGNPGAQPTVTSFNASPATIASGASATLSWSVSGATSLSLSPGGAVTGTSVQVQPTQTTDYTLTATNAAGQVSAHTTVTVSTVPAQVALFPEIYVNGHAPVLLADPGGTLHLVYSATTTPNAGGSDYPVRYGECAADCTREASWHFVSLGDAGLFGGHARLALDPAGHPRVVYMSAPNLSDPTTLVFARCDAGCTQAANWSAGVALTGDSSLGNGIRDSRYFALDPSGKPRLFVTSTAGTTYATCEGDCTQTVNWHALGMFGSGSLERGFSLAFGADGLPRVAFTSGDLGTGCTPGSNTLIYMACSGACDTLTGTNWFYLPMFCQGDSDDYDLALDPATGHPRLALYDDYTGNGAVPSDLTYAFCDADCTTALGSWTQAGLGLGGHQGEGGVALALTAQGEPRIAYDQYDDGLGYAVCTGGCATTHQSWSAQTVESTDTMAATDPPPAPTGCSTNPQSYWYPGGKPQLWLDPAGAPSFAYEVYNLQSCNGGSPTHGPELVRFAQP